MVRAADLLYHALYRGVLARLPAPAAIALGQWTLRTLPIDALARFRNDDPRLAITLGGVRLPNPIILSSMYYETAILRRAMGLGFGAVAGASAGSIVGALVAAGWPVDRIYAKLLETDFGSFKDISLRGLLLEGGIYSGNVFEKWVDAQVQGARFRDLPHDLFVISVDLIGHRPVFFSRANTPDLAVSRAVRCSMAIPWVWRPLRSEGRLLADGQLMPWIPAGLEMLQACPGAAGANRTMMLRLSSRKAKDIPDKRVLWPWDFAKILLDTMLTALENQRVPGPLWQDTILIQADRVHTLQLSISREDKEYLFQCGYDQAKRYFHKERPTPDTPPATRA